MKYFQFSRIGIKAKNLNHVKWEDCPVYYERGRESRSLYKEDFDEISEEEYENEVFDLRFEDGEWQQ